MTNLWIQETYLNKNEGYNIGESDVYETYTDSAGDLFRDMQREYGRCVSKVYVDSDTGLRAVGWVFEKRLFYEDDASKSYTREVWVTLHDAPPTRSVEYHYHERNVS